ncbi:hypothetical protein MMD27_000368 [Acinetobacter baumannii]|nr:hypothetical protein [Acinetobacter baumannii]
MLKDALKASFLKDLEFSGWTDSVNLATFRQPKNGYTKIVGEIKDSAAAKKIQVIVSNGVNIRFLEGNKIIRKIYWSKAVEDSNFESTVTDFLGLPFAQGREVFRSLMVVMAKQF